MEQSSGNFDTAVVERAEVVQVRKQRTECWDFQKNTIKRGFRSSWVQTSKVLLYLILSYLIISYFILFSFYLYVILDYFFDLS